jgi:Ca2+-binding RTX toxin-like protein
MQQSATIESAIAENTGTSNDILLSGDGGDFLSGEMGNDNLIERNESDRFLLSPNSGIDPILDIEEGTNFLTLAHPLTFSQFAIAQNSSATLIRLAATREILASVNGVSSTLINVADFG